MARNAACNGELTGITDLDENWTAAKLSEAAYNEVEMPQNNAQFRALLAPMITHIVPAAGVIALPILHAQANGGNLEPITAAIAMIGGVILMADGVTKLKNAVENFSTEAV